MAKDCARILLKNYTNLTLREIGERTGGADHTTVLYSLKKEKKYSTLLNVLIDKIKSESESKQC